MQSQLKEIVRAGHITMEQLACLVKLAVSRAVRWNNVNFRANLVSN